MLSFEEHVQRETFKPIRPNQRCISLLLFNRDPSVDNLLCQSFNWGFLCSSSLHSSQQLSPRCTTGQNISPCHQPSGIWDSKQAAPPYPRASKAKLEEPPSVPSRSKCFGQHRVAVICCTCDGYSTPVQVSLLGMALLDHDSSHHTVPKPKMCLLPPMTLPHSQPLADSARRCFFLGWLGPAQQPECFPWFKHDPCSGL